MWTGILINIPLAFVGPFPKVCQIFMAITVRFIHAVWLVVYYYVVLHHLRIATGGRDGGGGAWYYIYFVVELLPPENNLKNVRCVSLVHNSYAKRRIQLFTFYVLSWQSFAVAAQLASQLDGWPVGWLVGRRMMMSCSLIQGQPSFCSFQT